MTGRESATNFVFEVELPTVTSTGLQPSGEEYRGVKSTGVSPITPQHTQGCSDFHLGGGSMGAPWLGPPPPKKRAPMTGPPNQPRNIPAFDGGGRQGGLSQGAEWVEWTGGQGIRRRGGGGLLRVRSPRSNPHPDPNPDANPKPAPDPKAN